MKVEYVEETSVRKALVFEVEAEVVAQEIEKQAREHGRKLKLPGFRAGKIPSSVVKSRFKEAILQEAAEAIVNRVVPPEIEGRGLRPVAPPQVTDVKIEEGQPLSFRAVIETLPLVDLPEYRGLPVKARRAQVSEEEIDKEVERLREEHARYEPVEGRAAREGDFVVMDFAFSSADGKPRREENTLVELGASDNHPGLNAALLGIAPGETRSIALAYPKDHASQALAGRTVDYAATCKAIRSKVLPDVDDEFAKDLGEFGSLIELREDVRRKLLAFDERRAERELREALVTALVERSSFEVPESLVERHMTARTETAARSLALRGIDPRRAGVDWPKFRDAQREEAVRAAKADILLAEIAQREGIEALSAEVEAEVARYAERLSKPREVVRAQLDKEGELSGIAARIREDKTLDLLKANARLDFE